MSDLQKKNFVRQNKGRGAGVDRDEKGRFTRGHAGSKPKGATNKFTDLKKAYLAVFEKIETESEKEQNIDSFYDWATKNEKNQGMFYQMLSKMLPSNLDVTLPRDTIIKVISAVPRPKPEEKK
jgi:hypothetical protein